MPYLLILFLNLIFYFFLNKIEIPDYETYRIIYNNINNNIINIFDVDPFFGILLKIGPLITDNFDKFWSLIIIFSLLISAFIAYKSKNLIELFLAEILFFYIIAIYLNGQIRFGISAFIFIIGIKYYINKSNLKNYFILLSVCSLFHISFLIILILTYFKNILLIIFTIFILFLSNIDDKLYNMFLLYSSNDNFIIPTKNFYFKLLYNLILLFLVIKYNFGFIYSLLKKTSIYIIIISIIISLFGSITFADRILSLGYIIISAIILKFFKYFTHYHQLLIVIIISFALVSFFLLKLT